MFHSGMVITHSKHVDVAFLVYRCVELENTYLLEGSWLNKGFTRTYLIGDSIITIGKSDVHNWLYCADPEAKCLRKEKWIRL